MNHSNVKYILSDWVIPNIEIFLNLKLLLFNIRRITGQSKAKKTGTSELSNHFILPTF